MLHKISSQAPLVLQRYEMDLIHMEVESHKVVQGVILTVWYHRLLEKSFQNSTESSLEWPSASQHLMSLLWT